MKKKPFFAIAGGIIVLGIIAAIVLYARFKSLRAIVAPAEHSISIHYANNGMIPIKKIRIKAFYFIPRDRLEDALAPDVMEKTLEAALTQLKDFYGFQLHNAAAIDFDMYPEMVTGLEGHSYYSGKDERYGNPNGLRSVKAELIARVFRKEGDLYKEPFSSFAADEYKVMGIIYEGVGSAGSNLYVAQTSEASVASGTIDTVIADTTEFPTFFVSRFYLTDESYKDYGLSIFAHEFGHTLGLPDSYNIETNEPLTDDIMGAGRNRPLDATYLGEEAKSRLGLMY